MALGRPLPRELHRAWTRVDAIASVSAMTFDWLVIAGAITAAVLVAHPVVSIAAVVIVGARQHALLILMHEAAHRGLFRSRRLSEWVSDLLLAWPLFVSTATYRANHNAHHRHLNTRRDPDWTRYRDPEAREAPEWSFPLPRWRLVWLLVSDATGLRTGQQLRKMLLFGGSGQRPSPIRVGYYLALAVVLTAVGGWIPFLLYWVLPAFTTLKVCLRIRLIAEHILPDGRDGTRTTRTGVLGRFFLSPHHIGYHAEHHAYPAVRFSHLPRLHAYLRESGMVDPTEVHVTEGYGGVVRECTT